MQAAHGGLADFWQRLAFGAILLLSTALNVVGLSREGYGNEYYAATVLSMLQNWRNFFFASFDPGAFVSVDKPPMGFWIQAISAKVFGFSGWSVLLPEALAGVASVAVLYVLVRHAFGTTAGLLAALALAVMPVSVAVSRNNTIDSLLVLTVLLAAWAATLAVERGRLRWLLVAAATLGLGFEIKMLQAYLVAPAIFLLYLAAAPIHRAVRIGHLMLAGAVLLAVSLAWPVVVDLTPADQRPYVGSTEDNSAVNLALGYNGLERLMGRSWALGQSGGIFGRLFGEVGQGVDSRGQSGPGGPGGFGGPGSAGENGAAGLLRLLNQQLAGQASWLLPLAMVGMLVSSWSAWTHRRQLARDRRGQALLLWGTWLVVAGAFFSVAGYFHRYYLVMLGPPVAALASIGVWGSWSALRHGRRLGWLLPLALLATAGVQAYILNGYPTWAIWLTPIVLGGAAVAALALLGVRYGVRVLRDGSRLTLTARLAASLGVLALLVAPGVWAGLPALSGQPLGGLPAAGPSQRGNVTGGGFSDPGSGAFAGSGAFPLPGGFPGASDGAPNLNGPDGRDGQMTPGSTNDGAGPMDGRDGGAFARGARDGGRGPGGPGTQAEVIAFLQANRGDTKYLVATTNANSAAPIILATGQPVMALGGFLGSDPILTIDRLAARIQAGEVRFFLLGGPGGFGGPGGARGATAGWVQSTCPLVPASELGGSSVQLYDCGGARAPAA
ncbi:MAG: glycosyltransferase family 39 protein [Chloroflexi bacterium]|nr:glycosyltransferase family 39 protein [Chloroflexota bacterium]